MWSTQARSTHRAVDPDYELHFEGTEATVSGLVLNAATSVEPDGPAPQADSGRISKRTCTCPAGYYVSSNPSAARRPQLSFGWVLWTEKNAASSSTQNVTDIELSDLTLNTDVPGMILRESPTRASTGRSTLRTLTGGNGVRCVFDLFLELSTDGGQTWHAALSPLEMETIHGSNLRRFGIGDADPLPPLFSAPPKSPATYFDVGDKPTQLQFAALLDSTVNMIDDRTLLGLRHYDAVIEYQAGSTGLTHRERGSLTFGYIYWSDPKLTGDRTTQELEITQFDLSGGTMQAGMRLRESPTLPSRGRCDRFRESDGSFSVTSFFQVFTEVSYDHGATWSASDLPLHFVQQDRMFSSMSHSDQFTPQGMRYMQSPASVRCEDGSCRATECHFTSPPRPLPTTQGVAESFALTGQLTSSFTRTGGTSVAVSADVNADIQLTLVETNGGTRYFDAAVLSFTLTGTVSPAELRIRESPTRASLGRHVVTDVGGGSYRITSFFDIFTEVSVDGGQTWSECDMPMRLELGSPELDVKLEPSIELVAGSSTIDFGYMLRGASATRNVLISNSGSVMISDFGMSRLGINGADFSFTPPSSTTLAPGASISVPVTFTAGNEGVRVGKLRISSNDSDEGAFDIDLTARWLPIVTMTMTV